MNKFRRVSFFLLSRKQKIALFLSTLAVLLLASTFEATRQYQREVDVFNTKINALIQQQQHDENYAKTVLNTLSQYDISNTIKSSRAFEQFAQGLQNQSKAIHTIGFAHYLPKDQQAQFEHQQKSQGFESFNIRAKGLFKQESNNPSGHLLPISIITPLDPAHSIYLSEDLMALPGLVKKLNLAIVTNQVETELVESNLNQTLFSFVFKPVYLNDPSHLSAMERQRQVKGIVFLMLPIENSVLQKLGQHFPNKRLSLKTQLDSDQTPLFKNLITHYAQNSPEPLINVNLHRRFNLVSSLPESQVTLTRHWSLNELHPQPFILIGVLSLLIYFTLIAIAVFILRYTQHLKHVETRLTQIIKTSQDAVIVTDNKGYILEWNPEAAKLFGYNSATATGQLITHLIFENCEALDPANPNDEKTLIKRFLEALDLNRQHGKTTKVEIKLVTKMNDQIIAEVTTSVLNIENNIEISLFIKDVTYQRQAEVEIKQLAYFDPLTSLENRLFFKNQVEHLIAHKKAPHFSLMFLDLDGFKQVNDSLGHSVGDQLLKVIAKRITHTLRDSDRITHICRFGGDEFVFMLSHLDESKIPEISKRLLGSIEQPVHIDDDDLRVTASIGVAFYPQHGKDVDTLLRHADTAMYQSKDSGKNTFSIYNDAMEERLSKRLLIEKHLRKALELGEFSLVFQPQINLTSGKVIGVEALLRWENPILGSVAPDDFIPIAEESHLIISIGDWVAYSCIEQLKNWQNTAFNELHIAINVSSVQLQHPLFLEDVYQKMVDANLSTHLLEIELTERTVMSNAEENILRFNKIREQGFGLSVDDFGTGYSSLSYLKRFPLSVLKIDKSFVDGLPDDEEDISIASAILNLSHNLNMKVVAEGVEISSQLDFLRKIHCDYAQGYYISCPLPIDVLEAWLHFHEKGFFDRNPPKEAISETL